MQFGFRISLALICCNIVNSKSESILVDCVDTGVDRHTAENLKDLAIKATKIAQEDFQVRVGSFVTVNAANVQKMRWDLLNDVNIIQYGCSAHMLNLLAQDLEIPEATQAIIKVIKYFRNKHLPGAFLKKNRERSLLCPRNKLEKETANNETLKVAKHELFPIEAIQLGWNNCDWGIGAGMINMGNTCYLNSTLQALFHVPALVNWLMSDKEHSLECKDSVTHMGPTVSCGHYTAVAQAPSGNYYQFDDSMEMEIDTGENEINDCYRINKQDTAPILVMFKKYESKIKIIKKVKELKGIKLDECGLEGGKKNIYFNEDLTTYNQKLFKMARECKIRKKYKSVYSLNGSIFMRKNKNKE
ncbi:unnamed protein product [Brassicogethes aeneus]|uniref:ubiquitinyl hydrolase 1 n=1 Tax=Brassicogethes aeneus TaxID=1431903 RepID=A0A9P0F9R0_BRAAE|nr:unnamed protein product [Brassicogethes aeneus]